ncbi:MAG TPA: Amuc_1100 family pilus-like protein [Verrucomicrobiae bacterium]|nr:Amuc_1100 family pilus-like protein [Verrucomicrobiae bacterium]
MSWIKRNLYFFIGSILAVGLMGLAGWYLYSKWDENNKIVQSLNDDYEKLRRLNTQKPHPGNDKINNIQTAKDQQKELMDIISKARGYFQRIPPTPNEANINDHDFTVALSLAINELQKDATNASVILPPDYNFSFQAEKSKVSFVAGGLSPLAVQLGEIKTICGVLFAAKVNSLDNIRRERVSSDDSSGPQSDYLYDKSATNDMAVLSPYELTFKCFSAELAHVLAGFASSSNALIVKTINVERAPAQAESEQPGGPVAQYIQRYAAPAYDAMSEQQRIAQRYGISASGPANRYGGGGPSLADRYGGGGGASLGGIPYRPLQATEAPPPVYQPPPVYAPTGAAPQAGAPGGKGGLPTVLDEKELKVTLALDVMKLLPSK